MFSGMSMVKLQFRRAYFRSSVFFALISLTYLTVAFGLGVRTVLAPVGSTVSNFILFLTSLPLLCLNLDFIREMNLTYQPLSVRRGHKFACRLFIPRIVLRVLIQFWPFIYIFLWAVATKSEPWRNGIKQRSRVVIYCLKPSAEWQLEGGVSRSSGVVNPAFLWVLKTPYTCKSSLQK